jgi:indole-3-glycerol phosphate synthase
MASEVPSVLQKIVTHKREEVAAAKAARLRIETKDLPPTRGFAAAIRRVRGQGSGVRAHEIVGPPPDPSPLTPEPCPVRLIAEVKHASPVKGVLRADFDPVALARAYAENGAAAISVLTDERFFQGHPVFLKQIREAVLVPLLRKEFIIDEWQLPESRALGADAVLLIVAILSPFQLRDYLQAAEALGMDVLVEVHTEPELEVALAAAARIIGINNRNLNSFATDLGTTETFASRVKGNEGEERILVSESGIGSAADVARVAVWGVDAVLVGEALVRERDVAAKTRELSSCE